tara:strand:+ start:284 stop:400 length:117 start_codon:yes stop_codon:yes gene_type:complete
MLLVTMEVVAVNIMAEVAAELQVLEPINTHLAVQVVMV